MNDNCEYNREEAENRIDSISSLVDLIAYLLTFFHDFVTGKWLADLIKANL